MKQANWIKLQDVVLWDKNPNEGDTGAVIEAIRTLGYWEAIVLWRDNIVRGGNHRVKALYALKAEGKWKPSGECIRVAADGSWEIQYVDASDLDEHEVDALAVALNRTTRRGRDDLKLVTDLLLKIRQKDERLLTATGYDGEALDEMLRTIAARSGPQEGGGEDGGARLDEAEKLQEQWKVKRGDVWVIPSAKGEGVHRLICGDSTDPAVVGALWGDVRAVWLWSDPPYGVDYVGKTGDELRIENDGSADLPGLLRDAFAAADEVLINGAPIYIAHPAGPLALEFGKAFVDTGWHLHETLIWVKDAMVMGHSDYHYKHEPILYGWKGKNRRWYAGRDQVSVFEIERPKRSAEHPTMKPVALVEAHLLNSSAPGDIGYDPFLGSGTTMIAAEQLGRLCFGCELSEKYCAVILQRCADLGLVPTM